MPPGRHTHEQRAAFLSRADGSAVALLRSGGTLRLPSDQPPSAVRALQVADELLCPVEECRERTLDAALGTVVRHHFRHRRGTTGRTGHSLETAFHEAAKHLLRLWAEQQGASARVEGPVGGGARRADMLATVTTADGAQDVGFEVQYATLDLAGENGWPERTADYARAGVPDVWLFGHTGPQIKPQPHSGDEASPIVVLLNSVQHALATAGHRLRWINPSEQTVATGVVHGPNPAQAPEGWWDRPDDFGPRHPRHGDRTVVLHLDPLAECELTAAGMTTPTDRWLDGERERIAADAAAAKAQHEARQAERQAQAARAAAPRVEPPPAPEQHQPLQPAPSQSGQRPSGPPTRLWNAHDPVAWEAHSLKDALERLGGGSVPAVIEDRLPTDDDVQADHRVWHATVYARLVHGNAGRRFNAGQVVEALFQDRYPHRDAWELHRAGTAYLDALAAAGLLTPPHVGYYRVVADLTGTSTPQVGPWETVTAREGLPSLV